MPATQLKRAQRSIELMQAKGSLLPETVDALKELMDIIRAIEQRLTILENNSR
jgi:hypothetical protein